MSDKLRLPELSHTKNPPIGYHFQVAFFIDGVTPNHLDIRFQKVSGINVTVDTTPLTEGGENLCTHRLPTGIKYDNLKLERGLVIGSPLNTEFDVVMSLFKFAPSDILVSLLDEKSSPIANWLFIKAYPVKWSVSDLDANSNAVVIDTMELAYTRFQNLRI